MKNKLLISTALIALFSVGNVYAGDLFITAGQIIKNPTENGNEDIDLDNPDLTVYKFNSVTVEGGRLNLDKFKIRSEGNLTISNGEAIVQNGGLKSHESIMSISGGMLNVLGNSEVNGKTLNISGNAVVNVQGGDNSLAEISSDSELHISGGTINLKKNGAMITDVATDDENLLDMTNGIINMDSAYFGTHTYGNDEETGNAVKKYAGIKNLLKGGVINVNSGTNYFLMKAPIVSNTININDGALLEVHDYYIDDEKVDMPVFEDKGTVKLASNGVVNLSGQLLANIEGNGSLNIKSSNALVNGDISGTNLTFETNHSLSKAITGTIGDLASLNINKGTLIYDKQTGKIGDLDIAGGLDIGTNIINATTVNFKDNSRLALRVAGVDSFGKINATTINVGLA